MALVTLHPHREVTPPMADDMDRPPLRVSSRGGQNDYDRIFDKLEEMGRTLTGMAVAYGRMEEQIKDIRDDLTAVGPLRDAVQLNATKLDSHADALTDLRTRLSVVETHQRDPDPAKHLSMDQLAAVKAHLADSEIHVTPAEKAAVTHSITKAGKREDYWLTAWPGLLVGGAAIIISLLTLLHSLGML